MLLALLEIPSFEPSQDAVIHDDEDSGGHAGSDECGSMKVDNERHLWSCGMT